MLRESAKVNDLREIGFRSNQTQPHARRAFEGFANPTVNATILSDSGLYWPEQRSTAVRLSETTRIASCL